MNPTEAKLNVEIAQTVTVSFFRYRGFQKIWGMMQMVASRAPMRSMTGLQFFKPLGTGSGVGYSIWPDFSVFGMLGVWENRKRKGFREEMFTRLHLNN